MKRNTRKVNGVRAHSKIINNNASRNQRVQNYIADKMDKAKEEVAKIEDSIRASERD